MVGRNLDDEVEAYIVESALELPERAYRLVIHIAAPEAGTDSKETIASAVRSYFVYRSAVQARRLRLLLRDGRQALAMGLGFLIPCWGLDRLTHHCHILESGNDSFRFRASSSTPKTRKEKLPA